MQAARSIVALWQGDEGYSQCGYLLLIRCRNSKRFGGSSLNGYSLRKTGSRRVRVCFLIPDDAGPGGRRGHGVLPQAPIVASEFSAARSPLLGRLTTGSRRGSPTTRMSVFSTAAGAVCQCRFAAPAHRGGLPGDFEPSRLGRRGDDIAALRCRRRQAWPGYRLGHSVRP